MSPPRECSGASGGREYQTAAAASQEQLTLEPEPLPAGHLPPPTAAVHWCSHRQRIGGVV